jgi:hypothetical protein
LAQRVFHGFSGGDPNNPRKPFNPLLQFSAVEIAELEQELKTTLPSDYVDFLTSVGGGAFFGYPGVRPIKVRGSYAFEVVDKLYGSKNEEMYRLAEEIRRYKGRLPCELIPIGENAYGDQFCLGINGMERGKVYMWNHEDERTDEDYWDIYGTDKPIPREWRYGNVTLVANSFGDFFSRLDKSEQ